MSSLALLLLTLPVLARGAEPWIIATPVTISSSFEYSGDIVVVSGGSLTVRNVGPPGFRIRGSLLATGSGQVHLEDSTIRVLASYHGQYFVGGLDRSRVTIERCDYQVPSGVQHAIVATGDSEVAILDADFTFVQLAVAGRAKLSAQRLSGRFETVLTESGRLELVDIPRPGSDGELWVWPQVEAGGTLVYSPPSPGPIEEWTYPPSGSAGIGQRCTIERCRVLFWPIVISAGTDVILTDIAPSNWVTVGLRMPSSASLSGLRGPTTYDRSRIDLPDRRLELRNAHIRTWNLYPEASSRLEAHACALGEVLASGDSTARLSNCTVDGTGGYLGASDDALLDATDSLITCDVQASRRGTVAAHRCRLLPYPIDTAGTFTSLRVSDDARVLLDMTEVAINPVLGGSGVIGVTAFHDPPRYAPLAHQAIPLTATIALWSLDPRLLPFTWTVEDWPQGSTAGVPIASGTNEVDKAEVGVWRVADPLLRHELRTTLTDAANRSLTARWPVFPHPRVQGRLAATP